MKGFILSFIFAFVVIGCSKSIEKPKNLIAQEKIELILTDVHMYQQPGYLTSLYNQPIDYAKIDAQILAKHEVSTTDFSESFKYYVLHPEKFKEILENVKTNLIQKLPKEEQDKLKAETESNEKVKN